MIFTWLGSVCKEEKPYRCKQTIDLEDWLNGKNRNNRNVRKRKNGNTLGAGTKDAAKETEHSQQCADNKKRDA